MAKVIDIEADIPLHTVQLDALVVSKIIKHAREAPSTTAHGLLLGLDLDGTLEISNSFPLPHQHGDEAEKGSKTIGMHPLHALRKEKTLTRAPARHQASMLRSLKEVQADDSVVGFYQATTLGAFFNQTLLDTQAIHQDKLRHGGIVIVHGTSIIPLQNPSPSLTVRDPDLSQTAKGNASFRAFRLTAAFFDAYKRSNFSTARLALICLALWRFPSAHAHPQIFCSLISHRLTFSSIFEEVPLKIRTNPLLSSFLGKVAEPDAARSTGDSALEPTYSVLDLGTAGLTRNMEQIVEAVEAYRTEEGNLSYLSRQIAREKSKADAYVAKRKEENAVRVAQGLAPLPEEDVARLFKIPAEPSRLESLLLLGQIDAYAKSLEGTASTSLLKMYGARAGSGAETSD
jgi:translation initiation factor 3 subunit H